MTPSDIGTWMGTLFSVVGAGIALRQANKAKTSADVATQKRNEIIEQYEHNELSGLDGVLLAACKAMDKYGPGVAASTRRGSSPQNDATRVRAFTAALDRNRDMLLKEFGDKADNVCRRLNILLSEFGSASSDAIRLEKGREIYLEITAFSGNVKHALDRKVFR